MPSLFVLPSQIPLSTSGGLLAGCTLTFSATGSSTPQNVYSDIALTTPLSNPLSADGSGAFVQIYLDPSLPNYRVILKTQAGVTLKTWDDVPSNQNISQQFRLKATAPSLTFEETDASANNKIWRLKVNGEQMLLTILNDAEGVETTVFTFDRTGTVVDALNFAGQYLKVNGLTTATQENSSVAAPTLTGCTTSPTAAVTIRRTGTKVSIFFPSQIQGTSNSTGMSLTGMGTLNTLSSCVVLCAIKDNGVVVLGTALIGTSSIIFGVGAAGGNFTNSGTKGIPGGTLLIYDTDLASTA